MKQLLDSQLTRTIRVDHVSKYKQLERDQETGKMKERDTESRNAAPELHFNKSRCEFFAYLSEERVSSPIQLTAKAMILIIPTSTSMIQWQGI
jgi:hypothetical protein